MSAVGSASSRPSPESTDLPETPAAREIDDEESIQLEVEQMMNVTLNGLYTAVQDKKKWSRH